MTATRLGRGVVTVVPVTSNFEHVYPFQVLLPAVATGLKRDSKAQAEQVRSVAVGRVGQRLGVVSAALMAQVDEALRLHLALLIDYVGTITAPSCSAICSARSRPDPTDKSS